MSGVQPPSSWGISSKYFTMVPILGGYTSFLGLLRPPSFHEDLTPFRVVLFSFRGDLTSSRVGLCSFRGHLTSSRMNYISMFIIFNCGFCTKVTCAFLLQEDNKKLLELNTFKPRKTTISYTLMSRVLL